MSSAAEIISRIEDDPVFKGFLEPEFDATGFASKIVSADVSKQAQLGGDSGVINGTVHGTSSITTHTEGIIASVVDRKASAETVSSQAEITLDVSYSASSKDMFLVFEPFPRSRMPI